MRGVTLLGAGRIGNSGNIRMLALLLVLFNTLSDTEEVLRALSERLISIQQQAEELFLERCEREAS